jgi:hypothetical protein
MNLEIAIPAGAVLLAAISLVTVLFFSRKYRNQVLLVELNSDKMERLENKLNLQTLLFEETQNLVAEQTRRIAWLESNDFSRKKRQENVVEEKLVGSPIKSNITERRHQVLTLAKRGQDAEAIALTLGMLPGEVELIMNLNHGAARAANYA